MEIRGVGGINPMDQSGGKPSKIGQVSSKGIKADSLNISSEAAARRDEIFLNDIANRIREMDDSHLTQVRERLANGYYDKKDVLDALADKMIKALNL
ncbi:MAG: hypothetical protein ACRC9L_09355 [Brevinema sp.]